jgi:hypothetical protein
VNRRYVGFVVIKLKLLLAGVKGCTEVHLLIGIVLGGSCIFVRSYGGDVGHLRVA